MPPKVADLFGDVSPREAAERMEEFTANLVNHFQFIFRSWSSTTADPTVRIRSTCTNKSLSPDASAGLQNALAAQRLAMQDIQKEITLHPAIYIICGV
jgi:hypothetical protein